MSLDTATKELRAALDGLREEHSRLSQQIVTLETFLSEMGALPKRRGRPPKALAAAAPAAKRGAKASAAAAKGGSKRKRPNWSPEAREAARKRMQEYWAQRRRG
jgi:cell division septum initiation protein DivIVA